MTNCKQLKQASFLMTVTNLWTTLYWIDKSDNFSMVSPIARKVNFRAVFLCQNGIFNKQSQVFQKVYISYYTFSIIKPYHRPLRTSHVLPHHNAVQTVAEFYGTSIRIKTLWYPETPAQRPGQECFLKQPGQPQMPDEA